jgi:hypothetical protein
MTFKYIGILNRLYRNTSLKDLNIWNLVSIGGGRGSISRGYQRMIILWYKLSSIIAIYNH